VIRLVVDGNDGTGKSTLATMLTAAGLAVADRGIPTRMTDDPAVEPNPKEFYIILDAPVEVCRERLLRAGKSAPERYHTVEDIPFYRQRFLEVAATLHNGVVIDASGSPRMVFETCLTVLRERGVLLGNSAATTIPS
jgi:thymidylate kinase